MLHQKLIQTKNTYTIPNRMANSRMIDILILALLVPSSSSYYVYQNPYHLYRKPNVENLLNQVNQNPHHLYRKPNAENLLNQVNQNPHHLYRKPNAENLLNQATRASSTLFRTKALYTIDKEPSTPESPDRYIESTIHNSIAKTNQPPTRGQNYQTPFETVHVAPDQQVTHIIDRPVYSSPNPEDNTLVTNTIETQFEPNYDDPQPINVQQPVTILTYDSPAEQPGVVPTYDSPAHQSVDVPTYDSPANQPVDVPTYGSPAHQPVDVPTYDSPVQQPVNIPTYDSPAHQPVNIPAYDSPAHQPVNIPAYDSPTNQPVDIRTYDSPVQQPVELQTYGSPVQQTVDIPTYDSPVQQPVDIPTYSSPVQQPVDIPTYDSPVLQPVDIPTYDSPVQQPVDTPTYDSPALQPVDIPTYDSPVQQPVDIRTYDSPVQQPLAVQTYGSPVQQTVDIPTYDSPVQQPVDIPTYDSPALQPVEVQTYGSSVQQPVDIPTYDSPVQQPLEVQTYDSPALQPVEVQTYGSSVQQPVDIPTYDSPVQQPLEVQTYGSPVQQPVDLPTYGSPVEQPVDIQTYGSLVQQPVDLPTYDSPVQQPVDIRTYDSPVQQPVDIPTYGSPVHQPAQIYGSPVQQPGDVQTYGSPVHNPQPLSSHSNEIPVESDWTDCVLEAIPDKLYSYYDSVSGETMNCAPGTMFSEAACTCIHSPSFYGLAPSPVVDYVHHVPDTDNFAGCYLEAIDNDNTKYYNQEYKNIMDCAPGTVFSQETCGCIHDLNWRLAQPSSKQPGCKASYDLSFNGNALKNSNTQLSVGGGWTIKLNDGKAQFKKDSMVHFWSYQGKPYDKTFTIQMKFKDLPSSKTKQNLLTNCGTSKDLNTPSILIELNKNNEHKKECHLRIVLVTGPDYSTSELSLPVKSGEYNTLTVNYNRGHLQATIVHPDGEVISEEMECSGTILTSAYDLRLGSCNQRNNGFIGMMDWFKYYPCSV